MSDVLLLQHVRPEPPGTIAEALSAHGVPHRTVRVYRDEPVPDRLDADGLVVMGGPMGVGDLDDRPHLAQECALPAGRHDARAGPARDGGHRVRPVWGSRRGLVRCP